MTQALPEAPRSAPECDVTISLVTWDGARWLPGCLASIEAQTMSTFEVRILDNGSVDDSADIAAAWAGTRDRVHCGTSASNLGYAVAHDRHIQAARGRYVLLLNQDVELEPGFLAAAVARLDADERLGAIQPRMRRLAAPGDRRQTLDSTGLQMARDRRAFSRGQGEVDGPVHAKPGVVWGADGPAPLYRSAALADARLPASDGGPEVLDRDFFAYKEDVDLAWRLDRLGWITAYEPTAMAWHARSTGPTGATSLRGTLSANRSVKRDALALSWRNQRLLQIKNDDAVAMLRDAPWLLRREVLSFAYLVIFDPRRLSAVAGLFRLAPAAWRKRRALRAKIEDRDG